MVPDAICSEKFNTRLQIKYYSAFSITGPSLTGLPFNWAFDNWAVAQLKSNYTSKINVKCRSVNSHEGHIDGMY